MSDLIFLAVVTGFFAVAVALLRACEHIIGPDPVAPVTSDATDAPAEAAELTEVTA